ncbi:hypothetical protein N8I77_003933 [Diaporthe amygdali]|uniref:Uncharacterized protein n=1 Tax=Phomopsis amygdali TaxID=1214568 RepID=A0AAD9W7B3_PHOAM|nr:hypothetical protein N8I77_003933 [Diaporthe amygdali]
MSPAPTAAPAPALAAALAALARKKSVVGKGLGQKIQGSVSSHYAVSTTTIIRICRSCPLAEQGHQSSAKTHASESRKGHADTALAHLGVEHKLVGHELHQSGIDQDTGRDGVEDAIDSHCHQATRLEGLPNANADSNGDRGRKSICGAKDIGHPLLAFWPMGNG